jgi:hypothetical protein
MNNRLSKSGKLAGRVQTFTWFIPAPTQRKTGFREREFDKIMKGILSSGFKLLDLQTQSVEGGVYVVALLSAPTKKIADLDAHFDLHDQFRLSETHTSSDIILEEDDEDDNHA